MSHHYQAEVKTPQYQVSILQRSAELEACLSNIFHLDEQTAARIQSYLEPLLQDDQYSSVIDQFVSRAQKLNLSSVASKSSEPDEYDAVLKAAKWHEVLFENDQIRILRGVANPGENIPLHRHAWDHLLIVIQAADFRGENIEGAVEYDYTPIGFYDYPGDKIPSAFLNIGDTQFEAILFEIKKNI